MAGDLPTTSEPKMSKEVRPIEERLATLRIIKPGPEGIFSYYDGRVSG
jgi:hypothetical protein